jgi:hypothetical protein
MEPTHVVITAFVILAGIWELFCFFTGKATTFSRVMKKAGLKAPWIAFAVGFICGHWFGYLPDEEKK